MSEATAETRYFSNRDEFRTWALGQPRGRFERIDGEVLAMAPERFAHVRTKARVWRALDHAVREAGIRCEALADGVTVEVDDTTDFEPDALINCGEEAAGDLVAAPHPVVVVEVLSPGSRMTDTGAKLAGYFRAASLQHYLILHAQKPEIIHHRRRHDGTVLTRIVTSGDIVLDPPGLTLGVAQIYGDRG